MQTSHLKQYATVIGRKCLLFKRPRRKNARYVHPVPAGYVIFRTKAEAEQFKLTYDKRKD